MAADPAFKLQGAASEQQDLAPWGDRKPVLVLDLDRSEKPQGYFLPLDEISPLYGKSWREIGLDGFANHRTQGITGFLGSPFLRRPIALKREDGSELDPAALAQPLGALDEDYEVGNMGVDPLMRAVSTALATARDAALRLEWKAATDSLVVAGKRIDEVPRPSVSSQTPAPLVSLGRSLQRKREKIDRALALVAAVRLDATADRSEIVAGETFSVRMDVRHREGITGEFRKPTLLLPAEWNIAKEEPEAGGAFRSTILAAKNPQDGARASDAMLAEPPPLVSANQEVAINGYAFTVSSPVYSMHASSTRADRTMLRVVPAYTMAVEPKQAIEIVGKPRRPLDILLRVHSYATQPGQVHVGLSVPKGWRTGATVPLKFDGAGERYARVTVTPPLKLTAGKYKISAYAERAADRSRNMKPERFTTSLEPLPTLPTQLWSEPAQCMIHAFAVTVPQNLRVGYVNAESERVPDALKMLGIHVEQLDAAALNFGDLSKYNTIVVGVRAYELRAELAGANQRLLDYVSKGGTLVVQYQREFAWDKFKYAPYPALISPPAPAAKAGEPPAAPRPLPRITDENSPVKFLKPGDPLLNHPNKITQDDFKVWVQERGLYFWTQFDSKYTPLLAMNDPGEPELNGGLVYARYGRGTYIYTGLAFFRQLPEGVPGAYRLFVNLLAASRAK
jgi:hypothetical protein